MKFTEQKLKGVFVIEPQVFGDSRGYFMESYKKELFEKYIGAVDFIQDNESRSSYGVVRGLHFQKGESKQNDGGKLPISKQYSYQKYSSNRLILWYIHQFLKHLAEQN